MNCKIYLKFKDCITTCKNYNYSCTGGCSNFHKSAINEHSSTELCLKAFRK